MLLYPLVTALLRAAPIVSCKSFGHAFDAKSQFRESPRACNTRTKDERTMT